VPGPELQQRNQLRVLERISELELLSAAGDKQLRG